jgi:HK97 family phage major capsid protein
MEIQEQLKNIENDIKSYISKAEDERKQYGATTAETKATLDAIIKRQDELDQKLIALPSHNEVKTLGQYLKESDNAQKVVRGEKGNFRISLPGDIVDQIQRKTTVTSSTIGFQTTGVMPAERGGYVQEARATLAMRDVLPVRATGVSHLYWPKFSNTGTKASPVAEASQKPVNTYDPTTAEQRVKTIATYLKASRQSLEDWGEMEGIVTNLLGYKVRKEEDTQILFGDNTGENLNGVTTQAQAWALSTLTPSDGYEYVDIIGGAISQIAADNELEPSFVAMHPSQWWKIRMQKDEQGRYIFGDPASPFPPQIWGLRPVATTQMTSGYFLVGSGSPVASEIRERMGVEIVMSTEDGDNFTYNLVTIRAESRLAYCCYRPDAFVYGAFTQSPA